MKNQGVLLDFDGTISKNAIVIIISALKDYISQWRDIPAEFLICYVKSVTALHISDATRLLFESLGLADHVQDFMRFLTDLTSSRDISIQIEPDFYDFLHFCKEGKLEVKVFSAAGSSQARFKDLQKYLSPHQFIDVGHMPKSNPATFEKICTDYEISPRQWWYIDDSPLALLAAKQNGFGTIMMLNNIVTWSDYFPYRESVDYVSECFSQIKTWISNKI